MKLTMKQVAPENKPGTQEHKSKWVARILKHNPSLNAEVTYDKAMTTRKEHGSFKAALEAIWNEKPAPVEKPRRRFTPHETKRVWRIRNHHPEIPQAYTLSNVVDGLTTPFSGKHPVPRNEIEVATDVGLIWAKADTYPLPHLLFLLQESCKTKWYNGHDLAVCLCVEKTDVKRFHKLFATEIIEKGYDGEYYVYARKGLKELLEKAERVRTKENPLPGIFSVCIWLLPYDIENAGETLYQTIHSKVVAGTLDA